MNIDSKKKNTRFLKTVNNLIDKAIFAKKKKTRLSVLAQHELALPAQQGISFPGTIRN